MKENHKGMWAVLLSIVVILGAIGFYDLSKKYAENQEVKREEAAEKYQQELEEKILRMVSDHLSGLEKKLCEYGIADVIWTQCAREEYEETFGKVPPYCSYYFKVEYKSDEVATICEEYLQNGKELELAKFLKKCCEDKEDYLHLDEDRVAVFYSGETSMNVCINEGTNTNHLVFKTSDGQEYRIEVYEEETLIYKNTERIVSVVNADLITVPEEKTSSNSSYTSSYAPYSKDSDVYYDPYDVYDYDNADDFADEWEDEFADSYNGDYEDGYDDAYDYWEEEHS